MLAVAAFAARRPNRLARLFWSLLMALVSFMIGVAAWNFITGLLAQNPVLGMVALALTAGVVVVLGVIALREWMALIRLRRIDDLREGAEAALATGDLKQARGLSKRLVQLYEHRPEMAQGCAQLSARVDDTFDADGILGACETQLLVPLDALARAEVEAAARQVATVTAVVPLALVDVAAALTCNLRMIRRIAQIYGGRGGTLGSWRLTRAVFAHLAATGAVAVGDDLIGSVAGGGILSKLSRRFGEGVVNGALTARVGVAAIEVARPLPHITTSQASVSGLVSRALKGLFGR